MGDSGVEKDLKEAKKFFEIAAAQGDSRSQLQLAMLAAEEQQEEQVAAEEATAAAVANGEEIPEPGLADAQALAHAYVQPGAVRTKSGLVILHVIEGKGEAPTATSMVKVTSLAQSRKSTSALSFLRWVIAC